MSKTVLQKIKDEMDSLRSGYNGWNRLVEFFESNKQIQPYYEEIVEECRRDNYFGMATMMVMTIEKLLEEIEDLKDEIDLITGNYEIEKQPVKTVHVTSKITEVKYNPKKEIE